MASENTSREQLISLSRRWFEKVWNRRIESTIHQVIAPAAAIHGLGEGGESVEGPEGFTRFYRLMLAGMPDFRIEVDDVICDGDQTVVRAHGRGTHTGDLFGVPASGQPIIVTGLVWLRWRDGKIVEGWNEFDAAGMIRQMTAQ